MLGFSDFRPSAWVGVLCGVIMAGMLMLSIVLFGAPADGFRDTAVWGTLVGGVLLILLTRAWGLVGRPWGWTICMLGLLGWAGLMTWNAEADHSLVTWSFEVFSAEERWWPGGPGSVARSASVRALWELVCVAVGCYGVAGVVRYYGIRPVVYVLVFCGVAVSVIGFYHKATGIEDIWGEWGDSFGEERVLTETWFAPYVYNANAAQLMNLVFPLAVGLGLSRAGGVAFLFWVVAAVIAAGIVGAASKGAIGVFGLQCVVLVVWHRKRLRHLGQVVFRPRGRLKWERVLLALAAFLVFLGLVAFGISKSVARIGSFVTEAADKGELPSTLAGRMEIIELMGVMASPGEGGWSGFGPGSFRHLVPHYAVHAEDFSAGVWEHGHCDPMQTLVEWGYVGGLGWLVLGGGAVWCFYSLVRRRAVDFGDVPILRGMIVGLGATAFHSALDFPFSIYSIHLPVMFMCASGWMLYSQVRWEEAEGRYDSNSRR